MVFTMLNDTLVGGCFASLLTPLLPDGSVDEDGLPSYVEWVLASGVDGLVALGTTGEFSDLVPEERDRVLESVMRTVAGRLPVVVAVGALEAAEAKRFAARAQSLGASAILALPPLYWHLDDKGILRYFRQLAAAAEIPLILYNIPSLTDRTLPLDVVAELASDAEQFIGVKESVLDIERVHSVLEVVEDVPGFAVIAGFEEIALPALEAGAAGLISGLASAWPQPVVELVRAVRDGAVGAGRPWQDLVDRALAVSAQTSPPILGLKTIAAAAGAPIRPIVRTEPTAPAHFSKQAHQQIRKFMQLV